MNEPGSPAQLWSPTLGMLMLVDVALYVDATLRWELGLGQFWPEWLAASVGMLLLWFLVNAVLLRWQANGFVHAALAFPLASFAFVVASTGSAHYRWTQMAFFNLFKGGLFDQLAFGGGFISAAISAASHGALGSAPRRGRQGSLADAKRLWRGSIGLGLLLACCVVLISPVELWAPYPLPDYPGDIGYRDPRIASDTTVWSVRLIRWALWLGIGALGVSQVLKSKQATEPSHDRGS